MNKFLRRFKFFFTYLFFSVYWTAYELGEKDKPEENSKYFITLTIALNVVALFEILIFYGVKLNAYLVVFLSWAVAASTVHLLFFKKNIYRTKFEKFEYLKHAPYKKKRYAIMIVIALWSIAAVALGAIIRQ